MPLQKSFSDTNHSKQQQRRGNWQRTKSYTGSTTSRPRDGSFTSEPKPGKPPIPVSSATKRKLNVFKMSGEECQMAEQAAGTSSEPISLDDDKENALPEPEAKSVNSLTASVTNSFMEPPATPSARPALPDIIELRDMQSVKKDLQTTPDDRVTWSIGSEILNGSTPAPTQRKRKRARSSSPFSSPGLASAHFGGNGATPSLKQLSLATPQTGPDLWMGYGSGVDKKTPKAASNPLFAQLMAYTSSPQSAGSGREKSLKRSISCGTHFPKRKRLGVDGHTQEDQPPLRKEQSDAGPSKLCPELAADGPSSSSPLPRPRQWKASTQHSAGPDRSPLPSIQEEAHQSSTEEPADVIMEIEQRAEEAPLPPSSKAASSDYGDFDDDVFDDTVFGELEAPQPILHMETGSFQGIPKSSTHSQSAAAGASSNTLRMAEATSGAENDDDDEFADSDLEMFAADLEHIASKYDTPTMASATTTQNQHAAEVPAIVSHQQESLAQSEDEFGDDFDEEDLALAEETATQAQTHGQTQAAYSEPTQSTLPPTTTQKDHPRVIQRYLITSIDDAFYENAKGRKCPEKVLLVQVDNSKVVATIRLRDGWVNTPASLKAYVHVIGDFVNGECIVDDAQNMLILHPDHLISSTTVADSFTCLRKAVLQDRIKATSESSAPLVYGTILHEIFQAAMMANRWDSQWLSDTIEDVAQRHLEDLYTIDLQIPQAVEYLKSKMPELQSWAEVFIASQPNAGAIVKAGNGEQANMCVAKLLDVEEHVWSPMYGLKGNIDATVQVTMAEVTGETRTLTVPFEVKTGKNASAAHRAQTALYNLLLSDRYDIDIAYGILYYMESSETIRIPRIRHELRHMIMQRNELACYVRERHATLPPMVKKEYMCKRCYAKDACFVYHKFADEGNGETSGLKETFEKHVKHLTPRHKEFFLKWDDLLTKEEKESLKFRRELWTMLSSAREKLGRCFANVLIEPGSAYEETDNPKINRFRYSLIRSEADKDKSFLESQIIVGEPIVISDEKGHFALANGYVTHVRKHRITVAVDRRLHNTRVRRPGFDEKDNQVFASIMDVGANGTTQATATAALEAEKPVLYRLDKDEFSNGMATVRNNLIQLMSNEAFGAKEIRSLVVELSTPRFSAASSSYDLKDRESLNVDQQAAIEKVMSAQDYALVLGMPGTGKTTTIAHIIRALVSQGKSVLLTSYTHTAVDNILLKLRDDKIPILRLGQTAKINSEVQEFAELAQKPRDTFEEIDRLWHGTPVVATTCLGTNHPIFQKRTFDYCIVDEASQITLPVCLGPIRMARTFVLVGDHNQLPPLVQNEEARLGGLDVSLFKLLSDAHPQAVVNLEHQYRMCEDVMTLSNSLIYDGHLKCGTPEVAARSIDIPNMAALSHHHFSPSTLPRAGGKSACPSPTQGKCWIRDMLDPGVKAVFINTDTLSTKPGFPGFTSLEEAKGNRIVNPTEASIITQLVQSLLTVGVPGTEIGVMTHYRSQLALLRHGLRGHEEVEMHTCDRFQGRDKEVVVLGLVRSNEAGSIGELLRDWRRINVAFTRAKTKLLVVGSARTLKGVGSDNPDAGQEMVAQFVQLMERKGWVYEFPRDGLESHCFAETQTQMTSTTQQDAVDLTRWKRLDRTPKKGAASKKMAAVYEEDKENAGPKRGPKRVGINEKALLKDKPVLRDILNNYR